MKLKKIASLALAGLMAVSMLAGCGNNANSGNNNNNGTVSSSIVDAVNNGQDSYNKVKVAFTADAKLQDAVEKAIASYGNHPIMNVTEIGNAIKQYAGLVDTINSDSGFMSDSNVPAKDGQKVVYLSVVSLGAGDRSDAYLNSIAADEINNLVAGLDDTTLVTADDGGTPTGDGEKYYDFSYTGKICKAEISMNGVMTIHFAVVVIEQTAAEKTV